MIAVFDFIHHGNGIIGISAGFRTKAVTSKPLSFASLMTFRATLPVAAATAFFILICLSAPCYGTNPI